MTDFSMGRLAAIVGEANVLIGEDVRSRFDSYPPLTSMLASCIVRPASTGEVSAILALCNAAGLTVVPQGGRTGLVGGATTRAGDVALSLERMRAIAPIDTFGPTVEVEAGVPLETLQQAARQAGLLYPIDLGARGSATIGGTLATNAGGNSVLRYGMTRDQLLGLEVVLADGTVLSSMNRLIKNNTGYDLKQLFVGSEGTLGIITRAVVKLQPDAGTRATAFVGLQNFDQVLQLLTLARAKSDGTLTSFEVMWPSFMALVTASSGHQLPLQEPHGFYVLCEIVSQHAEQVLGEIIEIAWELNIVSDAAIAQSLSQADRFWAIRDDIDALVTGLKPAFLYDVSLAQGEMDRYVTTLTDQMLARWPEVRLAVFGHIADGNLHLTISTGSPADHGAVDAMVYEPLRPLGGSVSAEHGIGVDKRDVLNVSRSPQEIAIMRGIKAMLDPNNVLNPGKIFS